jgi:hypothetical protein
MMKHRMPESDLGHPVFHETTASEVKEGLPAK